MEGNKRVLACSCGFKAKPDEDTKLSDKVVRNETPMSVLDESKEDKTLPTTDAECPKCGHNKAYYWLVQTRAADEPETKFLKCEKCKNTWRDYS